MKRMKVIVCKELKVRLHNAALNGSVVARDILAQINSNDDRSEIICGKANYFNTKRIRFVDSSEPFLQIKVIFTACTKDVTSVNFPDHGNPAAPWFKENRTDLEPSSFVKCFKRLPEYSDTEMQYFANAICVDSRVKVKLYDQMQDFIEAYNGGNYIPYTQMGESTLHKSCMRHENVARNAADFYYHFAGAKILIATDATHNVLGRAVVWPKTTTSTDENPVVVSVIDRVYYSHMFVRELILKHAESIGINLRKARNNYNTPNYFIVLNPVAGLSGEKNEEIMLNLRIDVPASVWHKEGAPYMDTFKYVQVAGSEGNLKLELINSQNEKIIAECVATNGYGKRVYTLCPYCGKTHRNNAQMLCDECFNKLTMQTSFGRFLIGEMKEYKGVIYPACLIHKGRPNPALALHLHIEKLYES